MRAAVPGISNGALEKGGASSIEINAESDARIGKAARHSESIPESRASGLALPVAAQPYTLAPVGIVPHGGHAHSRR